jgi:ABC-type multidrug transport system ATPase subunit
MDSSYPVKVPRWTPSPSPPKSNLARADHDDVFTTKHFPFSTCGSPAAPLPPQLDNYICQMPSHVSLEMDSVVDCRQPRNGIGIELTWKELWVRVSNGKKGFKSILQGLNGYASPGQVLAIMGPSGSGKSTLLDALAGRLSSNTQQTGEILINGRREKLAFGTSAYVTQDDTLMTTLTVKEAVYYSAQLQLPDSMPISEKKERAEKTIKEMGLQDALNTRIGGGNVKGLSGGQKRRVSICIEILTRPKLLFLDEPTSGLDSAASYHVMNRIVQLARHDGRTVIASIHQPSSEVFKLFHNLCLLSAGRTVYSGPVSMVEQFFASNGFPCPPIQNPSDHYLRTINKDFDDGDEEKVLDGISIEQAINILVKSYKTSETCKQIERMVSKIPQQKGPALKKKGSQASFIMQSLVLTKRSSVNMYRDLGYYWLRLGVYLALCLCIGTIFCDIGMTYGSIQARGSMLAFVAAFLTFMAIGGFPSFVEDMKVYFLKSNHISTYDLWSRKIKRTLRSWSICDWELTLIHSLFAAHICNPRSDSLLPSRSTKRHKPFCLF